jgi:hypothetical protein
MRRRKPAVMLSLYKICGPVMTEEMEAIGLQEKKERPHGHLRSHGQERLSMNGMVLESMLRMLSVVST